MFGKQVSICNKSCDYQGTTFLHFILGLALFQNGTGTLISYDRPNTEGPKLSTFQKCVVSDWPALTGVLTHALGVKGIVQKQRSLFIIGQTRVHIDRVTGLGDFMELEVSECKSGLYSICTFDLVLYTHNNPNVIRNGAHNYKTRSETNGLA